MLSVTKRAEGGFVGATGQIDVSTKDASPVPAVGEKAPKVHTDTLESAGGDVSKIDTRQPPSDMHTDFAEVVGKKPVALLFSTPQLCASRVCGPVTDIALQMQAKYGDQMTFIHQEVYVDNDVNKGLREPLKQFNLPSEPWLFVVDKNGTITARLEGSIGVARVRGRRQVRPVRRACAVLAAALAAAVLVPGVAEAHGLVQRQQLPIPQWLFAWAAAAVLVISFFALAVLWPQPRLERDDWRPAAGRSRVRLAGRCSWCGERSGSCCWSSRSSPATSAAGPRWTTGRRRSC